MYAFLCLIINNNEVNLHFNIPKNRQKGDKGMENKRLFNKLVLITFTAILFLSFTTLVFALEDRHTLKVGYTLYDNFIQQDENGDFFGYGVDYFNEISKYTNFDFEYILTTPSDTLKSLKDKEIDLIYTVNNFNEIIKDFDYCNHRFGIVNNILYTRQDNNRVICNDYKSINGKKIAFLDDGINIKLFDIFAKKNNLTYIKNIYNSNEEMQQALLNGDVDIIATESLAKYQNLKLIGNFGSKQYYLASNNNNNFIDEIDLAISLINADNPDFEFELIKKYSSQSLLKKVKFTQSEKEYIKNCPAIKIGCLASEKPMLYKNKSGKPTGITIDILNNISKISGIKFEYIQIQSKTNEYDYDYFRKNNISIISGIEVNNYNENINERTLTKPYFSSQKSLVARNGEFITTDGKHKIAVIKGNEDLKFTIKTYFPNFQIVTYKNIEKCLDAVAKKDVDVFLYNEYLLNEQLIRPQYKNLSIVPGISIKESVALLPLDYNNGQNIYISDNRLISILNKSIDLLNENNIDKIIAEHTVSKINEVSFKDIFYEHRISFITILIIVLSFICLLIIIIALKHKKNYELQKQNKHLLLDLEKSKQSNNAKNQFLSFLSHEIRTPLNSIIGITNIAKQQAENKEKIINYFENINSSSNELLHIVNDVLDMSAIESEKLKIAHIPFDLKDILSSILNTYYIQCNNKQIEFEIITTEVINDKLIGDEIRLKQILLNLISNAYKFTNMGGKIKVSVSQTMINERTAYFKFIVSDNGIGMSDEIKEKLFMPFEQESIAISKQYGGSGLGLTIAKSLVQMMGGEIDVKSEKGKGSVLTVKLPFDIINDTQSDINSSSFKDIMAIVVEDSNLDNPNDSISTILKRIGVNFIKASHEKQAVETLINEYQSDSGVNVCFVDWDIKNNNSLDVISKIRQHFAKDTIIIVYAYDVNEAQTQAKEFGADIFIQKPLFQSTIYNTLTSLKSSQYLLTSNYGLQYNLGGKTVLLAEDNKTNREIVVHLLNRVNVKVDCADNGKIAVDKFKHSQEGTYDAILMDIQLPIMDGYHATREIRTSFHPQAKTIPIFAMTADSFAEDVMAEISSGMNGHISKPIDTDVLYQTLSKI